MHVRWDKGGEATVRRVTGDAIGLSSSIPSPPGSRLSGALNDGLAIRIKVHACRRQDDGTFAIEGRIIDQTRELRARLVALAGAAVGT